MKVISLPETCFLLLLVIVGRRNRLGGLDNFFALIKFTLVSIVTSVKHDNVLMGQVEMRQGTVGQNIFRLVGKEKN